MCKQLTAVCMEYNEERRRQRLVKIAALTIAAIESVDRKPIIL